MPKIKEIKKKDRPAHLSSFPNFSDTGSVIGMKKKYYGENALLVRSGKYIYNVTAEPEIYHDIAK